MTITKLSFLLAVLSFVVPLVGEAQQPGRTYRIGVLEVTGASSNAANLGAFQDELRRLGYVEGENLVIEYRSADGRNERFAELATELARLRVVAMSGLPAIYGLREFVDSGGLMSYGTGRRDLFRRSAVYVHRILHGANPADLPVEAPTRFELAINLKAARALGLTIPPSLLGQADYVIQ